MYLVKEGKDKKSKKYYSRENAVDRFEYLISRFLQCDGEEEMTKLAAKYSGFSTIDKMKYCRIMTYISTWASAMREWSLSGGDNEE